MAPTHEIELEVTERATTKHDVSRLRTEGHVPGVLYGFKLEPTHVAVPGKELEKTWKKAGKTHIITLRLGDKRHNVLIRELQVSQRSGAIAHVDFFALNPKNKLTADVPVMLHGEAPAVSVTKVGQLLQLLTSIKVECLPSDLPAHLTLDITALEEVDAALTVADITAPSGVVILHSPLEDIVVKIVPHRVQQAQEEEEEAPAQTETESQSESGETEE